MSDYKGRDEADIAFENHQERLADELDQLDRDAAEEWAQTIDYSPHPSIEALVAAEHYLRLPAIEMLEEPSEQDAFTAGWHASEQWNGEVKHRLARILDARDAEGGNIVALSRWIDDAPANAARDREAAAWGRVSKIGEEFGEVIEAMIGATGQNPRKGVTCGPESVIDELLDVAITALGAVEHLNEHRGNSFDQLRVKLASVVQRAGLTPERSTRV